MRLSPRHGWRHEAVSVYRWLRQFWPWHKRPLYHVRWCARHYMMPDWTPMAGTYRYTYTRFGARVNGSNCFTETDDA